MSAVHLGIQCNACGQAAFNGIRFKCLICDDFDLCAKCHEKNLFDFSDEDEDDHCNEHPMQSILTRTDIDLYYDKEIVSSSLKSQSFTCPLCGKMGFTIQSLTTHVNAQHAGDENIVHCPICTQTNLRCSEFVENLSKHLTENHRTQPRALFSQNLGQVSQNSSFGQLSFSPASSLLPVHQRVQQLGQLDNHEFLRGRMEHPSSPGLTYLAEEIANKLTDSFNFNFNLPSASNVLNMPALNVVPQNSAQTQPSQIQPLVKKAINVTPRIFGSNDSSSGSDSDSEPQASFKPIKSRFFLPKVNRISQTRLVRHEGTRSEKSQFVNNVFGSVLQHTELIPVQDGNHRKSVEKRTPIRSEATGNDESRIKSQKLKQTPTFTKPIALSNASTQAKTLNLTKPLILVKQTSAKPSTAAKPSTSGKPTNSAKPSTSGKPLTLSNSSAKSTTSTKPVTAGSPLTLSVPSTSTNLTAAVKSSTATKPSTSAKPSTSKQ